MLIIAGVGRCGTSMVAKWMQACGLDIGSEQWFNRVNAGLENAETLRINSKLIQHIVKNEHVNLWHIWGDIHDIKYDAVKDPQFLTDSNIIKHWWRVRKDIKVVFTYRNPQDVADSMRRHPEWNTPVYRLFPEMIEKKNDEFLEMCNRLEIPYVKIKYPHVINNQEMFDKLCVFCNLKYNEEYPEVFNQWKDVTGSSLTINPPLH